MNKYVSVIIAVYNEEKYINDCLSSLLKQDYQPIEIIVVDDGSIDNTVSYVNRFKSIKLFKLNHQGTAISRNYGTNHANGEILVFVDGDMTFKENFISQLVKPINNDQTRGTFSKLEYVGNWNKPLARCWNRNNTPPLPDKLRVLQDKNEGADFRAILKTEFVKAGGFDNTGYTDTWSLAKKLGYKPLNSPNAVYYHFNPETYKEVFNSSQWIGERKYKLDKIGSFIVIFRSFFILSLLKGLFRAIIYFEWQFILFQLVYDFGITQGAIKKIIKGKVIK